jgi:hypothetical protein
MRAVIIGVSPSCIEFSDGADTWAGCPAGGTPVVVGQVINVIFKAVDPEVLDDVWSRYHDAVNMTASELETWAANPCSQLASLDRAPIRRNLRLLRKPKRDWTERDVADAKRTISFVARMRGAEQGESASASCEMSRRDISLMNWGFDPRKG